MSSGSAKAIVLALFLSFGGCRFDSVAMAPPAASDASPAGPTCGDGVREGDEPCDGADLGGASCTSVGKGYVGGALGCAAACTFETAACRGPLDQVSGRDINGDGYADLLIGGSGFFEVRFGGPGDTVATGSATVIAVPQATWPITVTQAGDVDGDSYGDVVVGTIFGNCPTPELPAPAIYCAAVYLGGPGDTLDPDPDAILPASGGAFFLATAGDVNADGFDDILVGLPGAPLGALLYFGGPILDTTPDVLFMDTGGQPFYLGQNGAAAGDVDGDEFDDLLMGDPWNDDGEGRALLFLGGPAADFGEPDAVFRAGPWDMSFGAGIASAGDVDGDGYDDVLITAADSTYDVGVYGKAFLFLGGPRPIDPNADAVFAEPGIQVNGLRIAAATDLDGDGLSDALIVGGEFYVTSAPGTLFAYLGGAPFDASADFTYSAGLATCFGVAAAPAGDVNGDGLGDLVVGAPCDGAAGLDAGAAHLFLGRSSLSDITGPDFTFFGAMAGEELGRSVGH